MTRRLELLQLRGRQFTVAATLLWLGLGLLEHGYLLRFAAWQDVLHIATDYAVVAATVFGLVLRVLLQRRAHAPLRRLWIDAIFLVFAFFLSWTLHAGTAAVVLRRAPGGLVFLAATPAGSSSMRKRNSGLTSTALNAASMPASKPSSALAWR